MNDLIKAIRDLLAAVKALQVSGNPFSVTPGDGSDLSVPVRGLYVGTGGDVKVTTMLGEEVTFKNAPSGSEIRGRFSRVHATGTTASDIVGLP